MKNYIVLVAALTTLAAPCLARGAQTDPNRLVIALRRADLSSGSPAAIRRSLARIDRAAMAACGASGFSLREMTLAVHHSDCWRRTMTDALRQIGDPHLSQAWQNRR